MQSFAQRYRGVDGMLKSRLASVILVLSVVLAACGGDAEEVPDSDASETPVSVQTVPDTTQLEPETTETAEVIETAETTETTETTEPASGEAVSGDSEIVEHLRQKTMRLWEVYNTHDADALEVFYEETYWKEQEQDIRSNMVSFRNFGMTIDAQEMTPPTEVAPGKWETEHAGRFPGGSVHMVFIYEQFDGEWLLTYAEDH